MPIAAFIVGLFAISYGTTVAEGVAGDLPACAPAENLRGVPVAAMPFEARRALTACAQRVAAEAINARQQASRNPRIALTADVVGATLRYHYRLQLDARQVDSARRAAMAQRVRADLCGSAGAREVVANGGSYQYFWRDRAGALIAEVLVDAC